MVDYQAVLAALDSAMDDFNNTNLFTFSYNGVQIYNNAPMDIAWENVRYNGDIGRPYQEIWLLAAGSQQPAQGADGVSYESGIYQVGLYFPRDEGAGATLARGQQLRQYFKRGRNIVFNGTKVLVERVPSISLPRIGPDWYTRFVSIPYFIYS